MASVLWVISTISRYRRLASIVTLSFCILCCLPQDGTCLPNNDSESNSLVGKILNQTETNSSADALSEDFDVLERIIDSSKDPLDEGIKFLNLFIAEVNVRYGLSLTIQDACRLVRENVHTLPASLETQNVILQTIQLLESKYNQISIQEENIKELTELHGWYWPTEWKWFGLNKKERHKDKRDCSLA